MPDSPALLQDLQAAARELVDDLRGRVGASADLAAGLRAEWKGAVDAGRTGESESAWREERLEQVAAAWVLGCVFVRFLEDNDLVDVPRVGGHTLERLQRARDEETLYFRAHPSHSHRERCEAIFRDAARLPGLDGILGEKRSLLYTLGPTADGAKALLERFRRRDAATGAVVHGFQDPALDTRFLGDLYQDLSEHARKRYALLQTPSFIEGFLLDRTLEPAIAAFGLADTTLIDPACGSGHILLGAFDRLLRAWQAKEPGTNVRALAQRALDQVAGVDVNPFAAAIARFRLLVAALAACGIRRLADAPGFIVHVVVGDALLHGPRPGRNAGRQAHLLADTDPLAHVYAAVEDEDALKRILRRRYAAVVANPPYITPKDRALNQAYRDRFAACYKKYSLVVPFLERSLDLAREPGDRAAASATAQGAATAGSAPAAASTPAGFVGLITANSFMKREFGKKLIEEAIPRWDLTHVIDTSGAYIPGHGTPTVILFGRHQAPVSPTIRAVRGIRGEPSTPADPARGQVWSEVVALLDRPGSAGSFVSVDDVERLTFHKHPWSLGGGGAAELKERLEEESQQTLSCVIDEIGRTTHTGEDDAYYLSAPGARTVRLAEYSVPLVVGEDVRDFQLSPGTVCVFPYDRASIEVLAPLPPRLAEHFWSYRSVLRVRRDYQQTPEERGLRWYEHSMFFPSRFRTPLSLAFAFVATHNHFLLDRGGKVFNRTAPVIKLPASATEDDHLALLGLLNSSTACFWMQQVCHNKGGPGGAWEQRYEHDGTKLSAFPLSSTRPLALARLLDAAARDLSTTSTPAAALDAFVRAAASTSGVGCGYCRTIPLADRNHAPATAHAPHASPASAAASAPVPPSPSPTPAPPPSLASSLRTALDTARARAGALRARMVALQEELDWEVYRLYGLMADDLTVPADDRDDPAALPPVRLGERAFEIALAREVAAGRAETRWFERHGSTPITDVPSHWPASYRALVARRLDAIATNPDVALIERPEYKRRWQTDPWGAVAHADVADGGDSAATTANTPEGGASSKDESGVVGDSSTVPGGGTGGAAPLADAAPRAAAARPHAGAPGAPSDALPPDAAQVSAPGSRGGRGRRAAARSSPAGPQTARKRGSRRVAPAPAVAVAPVGPPGQQQALRSWLLDRLETPAYWPGPEPALQSTAQLADHARTDPLFLAVAEVYRGRPDFDLTALVTELTEPESVPAQAARRYKPAGLRKRAEWERVWDLQRREDAGETVGPIAVPPKYASGDFKKPSYWRLRGKLDVPKERFVSFPGSHRDTDPTPILAWAGFDHLQRAQAIAAYYLARKDHDAWPPARLLPLLDALRELIPRLLQWHNALDPTFGMGLGDYFASFLDEESRGQRGLSVR